MPYFLQCCNVIFCLFILLYNYNITYWLHPWKVTHCLYFVMFCHRVFFFSNQPFCTFCMCNICLDISLCTFIMSDRPLAATPIPSNRRRGCGETRHQRCLLQVVCVGWCETCPDSSAMLSWQTSYSALRHWADCQQGHTHLNNLSNGLCGLNNIDSRTHMHP